MRWIYATHVNMNCLTCASIDPCKFGFERNDADRMLLTVMEVATVVARRSPTRLHMYAESVPQSDARVGSLQFRVVYSASVMLKSDTHLVKIHIECMLYTRLDVFFYMCVLLMSICDNRMCLTCCGWMT